MSGTITPVLGDSGNCHTRGTSSTGARTSAFQDIVPQFPVLPHLPTTIVESRVPTLQHIAKGARDLWALVASRRLFDINESD